MQLFSQVPVLFQMQLKCVKKYSVQHTVNLDLRWIQTDVKPVIVNKVIRKHIIVSKVIKTCHCKQGN